MTFFCTGTDWTLNDGLGTYTSRNLTHHFGDGLHQRLDIVWTLDNHIYLAGSKALTYDEWPKMKRNSPQKISPFHFSAVRRTLRL